MYFDNISNDELKYFQGLPVPNFSIELSDVLECNLFKVETIIDNQLYRIYPLFYTNTIQSNNPNDKIFKNKCIICIKTDKSKFTFISDENESIVDFIEYGKYYDIGDTLTVEEYNSIVALLRKNMFNSEKIKLKNGKVTGEYGEYTFDILSSTPVDKGILIRWGDYQAYGTVTLSNPVFKNSEYVLSLTLYSINDINVCDEVHTNNIEINTIDLPLEENTSITLPFDEVEDNVILLYDMDIKINHNNPIIKY